MLEIKNVYKTFNAGTVNEKVALQDLNLTLEDGDFVTVIGGNGAGKSTMLNAVAGVWPIDMGKILIDGQDVTRLSEHQRAKYIGRVFQDPMMGTAATMGIEENLALAARRGVTRSLKVGITKKEREEYHELLKTLDLGLEDRMTSKVGLLSGGQRVENGKIKILGKDINEYSLAELRNVITYVPQDSYLFEGTIAENIAFGWNEETAPVMDVIVSAAKKAHADEFIKDLPEGYNTKVAAGGTNLSGGQRQRISIARAFMKEAPIVLMDEPSSALDTYSENAVLEAMSVFMKKKTVIMVSHRMTGAEKFNRVVRMD